MFTITSRKYLGLGKKVLFYCKTRLKITAARRFFIYFYFMFVGTPLGSGTFVQYKFTNKDL